MTYSCKRAGTNLILLSCNENMTNAKKFLNFFFIAIKNKAKPKLKKNPHNQ